MKRSIIFALIILSSRLHAQYWEAMKDWKLYYIPEGNPFSLSADTLNNFHYYSLPRDSMNYFLSHTIKIPSNDPPVWMGAHVATCSRYGIIIKIDISQYGGFFYSESDHEYFQIDELTKDLWQNYIRSSYMSIDTSKIHNK